MSLYRQGEGDFLAPMYSHMRKALHNINQSTGEGERWDTWWKGALEAVVVKPRHVSGKNATLSSLLPPAVT